MLTLTGRCLGTKSETVQGPNGSFVSTEFAVETGDGFDRRVQIVREGRDFPVSDRPKDNDTVTLEVFVTAYSTRQGAGYRLTANSVVKSGARVASVSAAS